jgi:hypothetical protein
MIKILNDEKKVSMNVEPTSPRSLSPLSQAREDLINEKIFNSKPDIKPVYSDKQKAAIRQNREDSKRLKEKIKKIKEDKTIELEEVKFAKNLKEQRHKENKKRLNELRQWFNSLKVISYAEYLITDENGYIFTEIYQNDNNEIKNQPDNLLNIQYKEYNSDPDDVNLEELKELKLYKKQYNNNKKKSKKSLVL